MDKSKFLVFDSGVGGLNVFSRLIHNFSAADFYYLSDGENCPYGSKSADELKRLSLSVLKRYGADNFDGVIIACNTLSTNVLPYLKSKLSLPVFGVFPFCPESGRTVLFATPATAKSDYVKAMSDKMVVCPTLRLAADVERYIFDLEKVRLSGLIKGDFDNVVLGCTHYIYMKEKFARLYKKARIYDGVDRTIGEFRRFFENCEFSVTTFYPPRRVSVDHFLGANKYKNYTVFCRYHLKQTQTF